MSSIKDADSNYSGTRFEVVVDREVRLLDPARAWLAIGVPRCENASLIAYQSRNVLRNVGPAAWSRKTGLLSIWTAGSSRNVKII
jgi:hypothetical protein